MRHTLVYGICLTFVGLTDPPVYVFGISFDYVKRIIFRATINHDQLEPGILLIQDALQGMAEKTPLVE